MSKFNSGAQFPVPSRGVIQTTSTPALTHEGGQGFLRTPRSELFLAAVTEMAEDKFYESSQERKARVSGLVRTVLAEPGGREWLDKMVPWLRHSGNMRSAPIILLGEMAAAGAQNMRALVNGTLARADEPAELLGYWIQFHGRKIPAGLKRGIADSAVRLYTERNALKYDGQSHAIRFGDVIDLTHPVPKAGWQSALFKQLIDNRHNRAESPNEELPLLVQDYTLQRLQTGMRREALPAAIDAQWSWERLAGWLPGGMDSEAWEAVIPNMGYMALLRNLRNFENAGVSKQVLQSIALKLSNDEEVKNSKQFPYRFLSAYLATESVTFSAALEAALESSMSNVPQLKGNTLILIDTSGSMQSAISARSQMRCANVAGLFGVALAKTAENVDTILYATDSMEFKINPKASTLRMMETLNRESGKVGYGTNTHTAIRKYLRADHDRIIILTDEQSHDKQTGKLSPWVHTINLAGYQTATMAPGSKVFSYGGFTDAMFKLIPMLENGAVGRWPWE
jgi:hypothetical protein